MSLTFFIAKRYIFAKRSFNFITIITTISIIGIIVGVAALITIMSIFNGFREMTEEQIMGFDPHLQIIPKEGLHFEQDTAIIELLKEYNEIATFAPLMNLRILGFSKSNMQVMNINAYSSEDQKYINHISNTVIFGDIDLRSEGNTIALGAALADKLKVLPGDTVRLLSPSMIESSIRTFRRRSDIQAVVSGLFRTNIKDYDITLGIANTQTAMQLMNIRNLRVSSIDIRLKNIGDIETVQRSIKSRLPENYDIITWIDLNKELYAIMQFERLASFLILSIIIFMAVFNILASLSMTVTEKKRDIGGLMAMGCSRNMITRLFIIEGFIIGVIGSALGTVLGLVIVIGQQTFKWFKLDGSKFIIDSIPVSLYTVDILIVFVFAMTLSTLAAIFPARRAAATNIIDAVRSE